MAELISGYSTFADWATDAADAVREKTESTEKIKPCNLPEAIRGIEVGARGDIYWLYDYSASEYIPVTMSSAYSYFLRLGDSSAYAYSVWFTTSGECPYIPSTDSPAYIGGNCRTLRSRTGAYLGADLDFPYCETIESQAFQWGRMRNVSFPKCKTIGDYAFMSCFNILCLDFPEVETIGNAAFSQCTSASYMNLPNCKTVGKGAFYSCKNLSTVKLPIVETIGESAFYFGSYINCALSFPMCLSIGANAFRACSNIYELYLPKCKKIGASAFGTCYKMSRVTLGAVETIGNYAFAYGGGNNMSGILWLHMTGSSIPVLEGASVFYDQNRMSIFVPSSMLASYKTATNWTSLSSRMVGI